MTIIKDEAVDVLRPNLLSLRVQDYGEVKTFRMTHNTIVSIKNPSLVM